MQKNYMHQKLLKTFQIKDKILQSKPFGSGHINDTFKVETKGKTYILQRVNHSIFKDVEGLMLNIQKISKHIELKTATPKNTTQFLKFHSTQEGKYFTIDDKGDYWRLMDFIKDSYSYDVAESADLAFEGGVAIGQFLNQISDFPANELTEILPKFHNIEFRINNLLVAIKKDTAGRAKDIQREISFALERTQEMGGFLNLIQEKNIPLRALHNDTKISNILFNSEGKGICMIDLDTLMPGYIHYDYGDAIRTFCSTAEEDETELSKVSFNKEYYQTFTKGFLQEMKDILTEEEKSTLSFGPKLLTYIMGIRFLADYLDGDIYYKVKHSLHNLERAQNQFQLLERIEDVIK